MRTLAWASFTMPTISGGASRQLTATLTALILAPPKRASKYSGPFLSMRATCSCDPTPSDRSACASWFVRRSSSPHVMERSSTCSATRSARSAPCVRIRPAMLWMAICSPCALVRCRVPSALLLSPARQPCQSGIVVSSPFEPGRPLLAQGVERLLVVRAVEREQLQRAGRVEGHVQRILHQLVDGQLGVANGQRRTGGQP